ncbi:hypothetical protein [Haliea sp. E17]|uniref:hypothetical protein n=1 Tax=Haliea sp. E17 TaxID=3401576 RepID=UPI003AAB20DD
MPKLKTFASAAVLTLAASQAGATVVDVTAVITGGATGAGTSVTTGSATGTYDDVSGILTLNYAQQQDTSAPAYAIGVMEVGGQVVADFSGGTPSATNAVTTCSSISGFDACFASGAGDGPVAVDAISGTWNSFTTVKTVAGATATLNYTVTANSSAPPTSPGIAAPGSTTGIPAIPVPGLIALGIGLLGIGLRRLRK